MKSTTVILILVFATVAARAAPAVVVEVNPSDATAVNSNGTTVHNSDIAASVNANPVRAHVIGGMAVENTVTGNFASLVQATDKVLGNVGDVNQTTVGKATSLENVQAANSSSTSQNASLPVAPSGQPRVIILDVDAATTEATTEASTTTSTTTQATTVVAVTQTARPAVVVVVDQTASSTTTTTTASPVVLDRLVAAPVAVAQQPIVVIHETETLPVDVPTTTTAQSAQIVQQPVVVSTFPNTNATSVLVGQPQAVNVNEVVVVASSTPRG